MCITKILILPLILIMTLLYGCSGYDKVELNKLIETYNKIKTPVDIDQLTHASLLHNLSSLGQMPQANIWLRLDSSHILTAMRDDLEKKKKKDPDKLNGVAVDGALFKDQAVIARMSLTDYRDKKTNLQITGELDIYAIPVIANHNVEFNIVASNLTLKKIGAKKTSFDKKDNPITVAVIDDVLNALLPYLSNLMPTARPFAEKMEMARVKPDELFKGIKCVKPKGDEKVISAKVENSAVVITPTGIQLAAFATSTLATPERHIKKDVMLSRDQATPASTEQPPLKERIKQELQKLMARSLMLDKPDLKAELEKPNYAIVGDALLAYAFNLLGKEINYGVVGTPCIDPANVDARIAAVDLKQKCKRINECRERNSQSRKCDEADKCKDGLHCNHKCKWYQLDCHARKLACETDKSAKILLCYTAKGVKKVLCEGIKALVKEACVGLNLEEVLKDPLPCGVGAIAGADNLGNYSGTLNFNTKPSSLNISNVSTSEDIRSLSALLDANLKTRITGDITVKPTGVTGVLATCIFPTNVRVDFHASFEGSVHLTAQKQGQTTDDKGITTHTYKSDKTKFKVRMDKDILSGILLKNPLFPKQCPGGFTIGVIDYLKDGDNSKNTVEVEIDATEFEFKVQPIEWKFDDNSYRVPVMVGAMVQKP